VCVHSLFACLPISATTPLCCLGIKEIPQYNGFASPHHEWDVLVKHEVDEYASPVHPMSGGWVVVECRFRRPLPFVVSI